MEDELGSCLLGCLIQSVFHTQRKPLITTVVCNQGNHSGYIPQIALCNKSFAISVNGLLITTISPAALKPR